jgi:hypothetical protein
MYLVSRLDGPRGLWDALEEIDQAQYAQKYLYPGAGYFNGTVYVDDEGRDANYTDAWLQASSYVQTGNYSNYGPADENIAQTEHYVAGSGLPLKWQNTGALIGDAGATFTDGSSATSAPNALFFSGWYGLDNVYSWLPGSVADNLISNSLVGMEGNGTGGGTLTPQLGEGLTAAVGVVGEPYVNGHPRPNILTYYLLKGYSFAEAAMLSTPYLGWMGVSVGDPLYAPLAPKTATHDTTTPMPTAGFNPGAGSWDASGNYHLNLSIDNSNGPEVASAVVQYGTTTSYGQTASSAAFYERPALTLTGLTPGWTYHMKLTLTNPAGTVWTSSDYVFTAPPQTIYQDTFTGSGDPSNKQPTVDTTGARWNSIGWYPGGTATETGAGVSINGNMYDCLALTTSTLQTTAGIYTLTAGINSTGPSAQWVALGFGKSAQGTNSPYDNANALVTLCGPASGGSGGTASTFYGTGTGSSGNPASGTVHGNGVDTISVILTTDGNGGATVSFSDTAGLLPQNSGGALTSAQLANINDLFIGANGTGAGTFSDLTLTFRPAGTSTTRVTSSRNTSGYGQSVTFRATVAAGGQVGVGMPGETVTFMDGTATLGTSTLNVSGIATFTTTALALGVHAITAVYSGDNNFTGSTGEVPQTVYIPGDINNDGLVDVADYDIWAANVGKTGATWSQGDLNGDGLVDVSDYDIWAANVGKTASSYSTASAPSDLATPSTAVADNTPSVALAAAEASPTRPSNAWLLAAGMQPSSSDLLTVAHQSPGDTAASVRPGSCLKMRFMATTGHFGQDGDDLDLLARVRTLLALHKDPVPQQAQNVSGDLLVSPLKDPLS